MKGKLGALAERDVSYIALASGVIADRLPPHLVVVAVACLRAVVQLTTPLVLAQPEVSHIRSEAAPAPVAA